MMSSSHQSKEEVSNKSVGDASGNALGKLSKSAANSELLHTELLQSILFNRQYLRERWRQADGGAEFDATIPNLQRQ